MLLGSAPVNVASNPSFAPVILIYAQLKAEREIGFGMVH